MKKFPSRRDLVDTISKRTLVVLSQKKLQAINSDSLLPMISCRTILNRGILFIEESLTSRASYASYFRFMMTTSNSATDERAALLVDAETASAIGEVTDQHDTDVYDRFAPTKKRVIVFIVSLNGLIPCALRIFPVYSFDCSFYLSRIVFVSGSFIPSIPQIVKDLGSTVSVIR